jgi:MoxR-like ATPase
MKTAPGPIPTPLVETLPVEAIQSGIEELGSSEYGIEHLKLDGNYAAVIPHEDPLYVPFGNYEDVQTITTSGKFFPYWIFGLSGNGKTLSIEQAHARNKRKLVLVPVTREADEDSLLGGLRLINGNTVPFLGPVTLAALLGVTVCLDETDLGDEKLMCLQTPLQNRPFLIKRLGRVIHPKPGFNIVATANTKGQGSEEGKFVGTNIMNEAMLDRYIVVFEQDYPDGKIERQILQKVLSSLGHTRSEDEQFIERLLTWADKIRTTFASGATSEVITTRRLVHICRAYDMFERNRKKAVKLCLARFNENIKISFMEFYELIDADCNKKESEAKRVASKKAKGIDPEIPF